MNNNNANISENMLEATALINEFAPIANRVTALAEKLDWPDLSDACPLLDRENEEAQLCDITNAMRKALCILLGAAAEQVAYPDLDPQSYAEASGDKEEKAA